MTLDTRTELVERLSEVRTQIAKARGLAEFSADGGSTFKRAPLKVLLEEEQMLERKINAMDAQARGGRFNKARFA